MQSPLFSLFLAILAVISAIVLPVNVNEDSLQLTARDENAVTASSGNVADFDLLYTPPSSGQCGTVSTAVVFNHITKNKFSPACQAFYDYMTTIPGHSILKNGVRGVSLIYICPPKGSVPITPPDLGELDLKLIVSGTDVLPIIPQPVDVMLTVWNFKEYPVTNFTLPASIEYEFITEAQGKSQIELTAIHCK